MVVAVARGVERLLLVIMVERRWLVRIGVEVRVECGPMGAKGPLPVVVFGTRWAAAADDDVIVVVIVVAAVVFPDSVGCCCCT